MTWWETSPRAWLECRHEHQTDPNFINGDEQKLLIHIPMHGLHHRIDGIGNYQRGLRIRFFRQSHSPGSALGRSPRMPTACWEVKPHAVHRQTTTGTRVVERSDG